MQSDSDERMNECENQIQQLEERIRHCEALLLQAWKKDAKEHASAMLRDRGSALRYLTEEDPILRALAADTFLFKWGIELDVIELIASQLISHDPCDTHLTVNWLVCASRRGHAPAVSRALAAIVLDGRVSSNVRIECYHALLLLYLTRR